MNGPPCVCYTRTFAVGDERIDPLKMEADWRADALQDELIKLKRSVKQEEDYPSPPSCWEHKSNSISVLYFTLISLPLAFPVQLSEGVQQYDRVSSSLCIYCFGFLLLIIEKQML